MAHIIGIQKTVSMAAEAVHVTVAVRNSPVAHGDGYLMQSFGQARPKVPIIVRAAHIGVRVALYGMIEIGKFERVSKEENRSVVSH